MRVLLSALILCCLLPATARAELGTDLLERGDRGGDVRRLQAALSRLHAGRVTRDGIFGSQTLRAVRRYERSRRLQVDGEVSPGQGRGMLRRIGWTVPPPPAAGPATAPGPAATGFAYPIQGRTTVGDGFRDRGGRHQGVDLLAACGTPLIAISAGTVTMRDSGGKAGRHVAITAADGTEWLYMHLRDVVVHTGDQLAAGSPVGSVGDSGNATTCHLHLEQRPAPGRNAGAAAVDPETLLDRLPH